MRALWFLLLVGCSSSPLPPSADAGLSGESCDQLNHEIEALLAAHRACSSDGDCTRFDTVCTQPTRDHCNRSYAITVRSTNYTPMILEWYKRCAVTCLDCPPQVGNAGCNAGVCGFH